MKFKIESSVVEWMCPRPANDLRILFISGLFSFCFLFFVFFFLCFPLGHCFCSNVSQLLLCFLLITGQKDRRRESVDRKYKSDYLGYRENLSLKSIVER